MTDMCHSHVLADSKKQAWKRLENSGFGCQNPGPALLRSSAPCWDRFAINNCAGTCGETCTGADLRKHEASTYNCWRPPRVWLAVEVGEHFGAEMADFVSRFAASKFFETMPRLPWQARRPRRNMSSNLGHGQTMTEP